MAPSSVELATEDLEPLQRLHAEAAERAATAAKFGGRRFAYVELKNEAFGVRIDATGAKLGTQRKMSEEQLLRVV
jgi:hypothetical protein